MGYNLDFMKLNNIWDLGILMLYRSHPLLKLYLTCRGLIEVFINFAGNNGFPIKRHEGELSLEETVTGVKTN